jgi:RNA polymerase sigma-70 factor (ECF subfamily)
MVQETFVAVERQLPEFEGRSSVETWLYAIAWRVAANYHRRRRRTGRASLHAITADHQEPPVEETQEIASYADIDGEQRDLLSLHELGGLSISSLAQITGSARATIRERLARGRSALDRAIASRRTNASRDAWLDGLSRDLEPPSEPLPPGEVLVTSCGHVAISTAGDLVIAVFRGRPTDVALQTLIPVLVAHAHARPGGIRYLAVIEPSSSTPTRRGREMIAWSARKLGSQVRASANAVEGRALMHLVAPIMNTCFLLARTPINMSFFARVDESLAWLEEHGDLDVRAVLGQVDRMRAVLGQRRG